jgi:hypothetical protein
MTNLSWAYITFHFFHFPRLMKSVRLICAHILYLCGPLSVLRSQRHQSIKSEQIGRRDFDILHTENIYCMMPVVSCRRSRSPYLAISWFLLWSMVSHQATWAYPVILQVDERSDRCFRFNIPEKEEYVILCDVILCDASVWKEL